MTITTVSISLSLARPMACKATRIFAADTSYLRKPSG
jgi:hypothetical protein